MRFKGFQCLAGMMGQQSSNLLRAAQSSTGTRPDTQQPAQLGQMCLGQRRRLDGAAGQVGVRNGMSAQLGLTVQHHPLTEIGEQCRGLFCIAARLFPAVNISIQRNFERFSFAQSKIFQATWLAQREIGEALLVLAGMSDDLIFRK